MCEGWGTSSPSPRDDLHKRRVAPVERQHGQGWGRPMMAPPLRCFTSPVLFSPLVVQPHLTLGHALLTVPHAGPEVSEQVRDADRALEYLSKPLSLPFPTNARVYQERTHFSDTPLSIPQVILKRAEPHLCYYQSVVASPLTPGVSLWTRFSTLYLPFLGPSVRPIAI